MVLDIANDRRLDPRLRSLLAAMPQRNLGDVASREELIAESNTAEAHEAQEIFRSFQELCDTEEYAPSTGLVVRTMQFESQPDGNTINLQHHEARHHRGAPLRLLHPWRGHGLAVLLRRHVPGLGQAHRRQRGGRGHGRLPQLRRRRPRHPRWPLSPPGSTTASPDCIG